MERPTNVIAVAAIALLSVGTMGAKYGVLVCPHWVTYDNRAGWSDYWYSLFMAYEALVDHGYTHSNLTVLYHNGEDFVSKYHRCRNRWACEISNITDLPFSDTLFDYVLDSLGSAVVSSDDSLLVWWVCGHGNNFQLGSQGDSCSEHYSAQWNRLVNGDNIDGVIFDTTISRIIDQVDHYRLKTVLWSTCNTGKLLDSLTPTDSTLALGAVQWHHYLTSVEDTMQDGGWYPATDTVGVSGFTMYLAYLMNRHGLRGNTYDGDTSGDGLLQTGEYKYLVDSMYRRNPYLLTDDYGKSDDWCGGSAARTYDTVQILDPGGIAPTTVLAPSRTSRHIAFRHKGTVKGRATDAGYLHLTATAGAGSPAGLLFGGVAGIDTNGNFVWQDALLEHNAVWLDSTGDLSGGLKFGSPCGQAVLHFDAADTVRTRAWVVEEHPELQ